MNSLKPRNVILSVFGAAAIATVAFSDIPQNMSRWLEQNVSSSTEKTGPDECADLFSTNGLTIGAPLSGPAIPKNLFCRPSFQWLASSQQFPRL